MNASKLGTYAIVVAVIVLGVAILAGGDLIDRFQQEDAPDFQLVSFGNNDQLGDDETSFSDVQVEGQPVVLNFWAADCPPCRAELPMLQEVAAEYEGEVLFLALGVGVFTGLGSREGGAALLDELGIRFPAAYAVNADPVRDYDVQFMPSTMFISGDGAIVDRVDRQISERELRELLGNLV